MKRVLVCEDEETIREFVVINLKRSGYDSLTEEEKKRLREEERKRQEEEKE